MQKYGGSSVASAEHIDRVAKKIVADRKAGFDLVVVVSAMGKTTDGLMALASSIHDRPPRRELDMLLSTGERVTMSLLAMALHKYGAPAISFTGSQSGLITNDRHYDAKIIDVRPHRVEDELARGKIVIIAGYQGMSYKREITTLGRGGSDTTALAMAAALGAERAEIYSDVDGVYSADPNKVPTAEHLPAISYEDMRALSDAGAKVLHAQAVAWAQKAGLPIFARSTADSMKPDGGRQTIIGGNAHSPRPQVVICDDVIALPDGVMADAVPFFALSDAKGEYRYVREVDQPDSAARADDDHKCAIVTVVGLSGSRTVQLRRRLDQETFALRASTETNTMFRCVCERKDAQAVAHQLHDACVEANA